MAVFTQWLGSRALTPIQTTWFAPAFEQSDAVTNVFAPFTTQAATGTPYNVTLTRTRVDFFGNVVAATAPVASYGTGPHFSISADEVAPDDVAAVFTTATAGAAAGTSDIDVQRYDAAGTATGGVTTLASGIAGYEQLRIGSAATYGAKYFLAYSTFDASTGSEKVNLLAYNADNSPLPAETGTLDSFTTGNGTYDGFGFGTLHASGTADPSFIYLVGYEENGDYGVRFQPVSTDGVRTGTAVFLAPFYPSSATNKFIDGWAWTRLLAGAPGTSSTSDLAVAMPFSYTDTAGTHYGLDVKIADTVHGSYLDDTIALAQSAYTHVSLADLPDGGLVVGYTDSGTEYLREYGNEGFVVGSSSFALPAGITDVSLSSLGDGRVLLEYPQAGTGGQQLDYAIYDTRQSGVTIDDSAETAPSDIAGTVNNDIVYIGGAAGADTIVGGGGTDIVVTTKAAGTGSVLVDLKDGFVSRGNQLDAHIFGMSGATLGAQSSVVLGLTTGIDVAYGASGALAFYNEGGTDYVSGGTGSNAIVGGSGTTIFYGAGGSDTMRGGAGGNFMQAGPTAGSTDVFYGTTGRDFVYGSPGATTLIGGSGTEMLMGGSGYNALIGSSQSAAALNVFNGGSGTDVFDAGIGTNLLYEGSGNDTLTGSAGTDYVYGGSGHSVVHSGSGIDVITTGAGNQDVMAGAGLTFFNDTAADITAGRDDRIDNFSGGQGTNLYLPSAVQGKTSFVSQNGGTAVLTQVSGGTAEIFASNTTIAAVQSHTHFTL